ncbi:hypothetical protein RHMOL_Rhmol06G0060000 [Rhododendron molle]|uniref:Uncharacterized protein n=1 Tax=Rhododendron molle TaxID=49168 RepID=A0ACC0NA56_RHOML|nr:hypothetical protein RHMOL_Rhmol06G0060000 [Rhododendron molle]
MRERVVVDGDLGACPLVVSLNAPRVVVDGDLGACPLVVSLNAPRVVVDGDLGACPLVVSLNAPPRLGREAVGWGLSLIRVDLLEGESWILNLLSLSFTNSLITVVILNVPSPCEETKSTNSIKIVWLQKTNKSRKSLNKGVFKA